jgi:hypothetical protein
VPWIGSDQRLTGRSGFETGMRATIAASSRREDEPHGRQAPAAKGLAQSKRHELLAPTFLRTETLSILHAAVHGGRGRIIRQRLPPRSGDLRQVPSGSGSRAKSMDIHGRRDTGSVTPPTGAVSRSSARRATFSAAQSHAFSPSSRCRDGCGCDSGRRIRPMS